MPCNDGTEVAKFYTDSSAKVVTAPTAWHHVVFVAKGEKSEFWVDGKLAASKTYASAEGENSSGDKRAFFSDIENLDFVAIGAPFFNTENNNTESFRGHIDDFYIYNRDLSASERLIIFTISRMEGSKYLDLKQWWMRWERLKS